MTFNPIVAISEQLQKLINEHGSAAILRDHLALIKDQVVALEKLVKKLEAEKGTLLAENESLNANISLMQSEIGQLKKQLAGFEEYSLTDKHYQVLEFLFQKPASIERVCKHLSLKTEEAKYYMQHLYNENLVDPPTAYAPGEEEWSLSQDGRRLVMGRGASQGN